MVSAFLSTLKHEYGPFVPDCFFNNSDRFNPFIVYRFGASFASELAVLEIVDLNSGFGYTDSCLIDDSFS